MYKQTQTFADRYCLQYAN